MRIVDGNGDDDLQLHSLINVGPDVFANLPQTGNDNESSQEQGLILNKD